MVDKTLDDLVSGAPAGALSGSDPFETAQSGVSKGGVMSQVATYILGALGDTDGTLAANSDSKFATQKAVKTYTGQIVAAQDAMVYKGVIDCSANPNYPAADAGWTYRISVAGKIGGASGVVVQVGDIAICLTDSTASGNQATVGANWNVIQANIDGALVSTDIGVTVQGYDADLAAIAALTSAADKVPYATGAGAWALATVTSAARTVLDDTTTAAMLTTLGALPAGGGSMSGAITIPAGAVGTPSLNFTGSLTTGIWSSAADTIDFSIAGGVAFRLDSSKRALLGSTAYTAIATRFTTSAITPVVQIATVQNPLLLAGFTNSAVGPIMYFAKSRNATIGSHTTINSGDTFGVLTFAASDGTQFCEGARISVVSSGVPVGNYTPSYIDFLTSPGTTAPAIGVSVKDDGALAMGTGRDNIFNANRHQTPRQYAAGSLPTAVSGEQIASSDIVGADLVSDGTSWLSPGVKRATAANANTTISVPPGWAIDQIFYANTTAGTVTGGVKIGTTSGATDVVAAQAVGANAIGVIADANVLLKLFSRTVAQTLFIQPVTSWNSQTVEFSFSLEKVF